MRRCLSVFMLDLSNSCLCAFLFLFFKQKTAYEMRISDWSSDVCSSDLWTYKRFKRQPGGRRLWYRQSYSLLKRAARGDDGLRKDRSEERRVGKECVSTCRSRWAPDH